MRLTLLMSINSTIAVMKFSTELIHLKKINVVNFKTGLRNSRSLFISLINCSTLKAAIFGIFSENSVASYTLLFAVCRIADVVIL